MIILFFLGLGLICFIISIILESIGFDEETSLDIGRYIVIAILLLFVGGSFLKAVYEEVTTPESNSYTSSSYSSSDSPDYDVEAPSGGGITILLDIQEVMELKFKDILVETLTG